MKYTSIYERCESAQRLESILLLTSGVTMVAAMVTLWRHGFLFAAVVAVLSVLSYGLSQLFGLLSDVMSSVGRLEENRKTGQTPDIPASK